MPGNLKSLALSMKQPRHLSPGFLGIFRDLLGGNTVDRVTSIVMEICFARCALPFCREQHLNIEWSASGGSKVPPTPTWCNVEELQCFSYLLVATAKESTYYLVYKPLYQSTRSIESQSPDYRLRQ